MDAQYALMGRKRTRDFDLPPRMHAKVSASGSTRYYHVAQNKWTALGADLDVARRKWAEYECMNIEASVADLVDEYLAHREADKQRPLAANTLKQYRKFAKRIRNNTEWGALAVETLRAPTLAQWRDSGEVGAMAFNGLRSLVAAAYDKGIEWGWVDTNPVEKVAHNPGNERERYLNDQEFVAIREKAPEWMALAMDIAYLTSTRPIDAFTLRWDQIKGDKLLFRPAKTRKHKLWIEKAITPPLRAILEAAKRRPILGLYIVANEKGRPIKEAKRQEVWREIARALEIEDSRFADIRAKSGTDADEQGLAYQDMLGHTTKRMSDRYLKKGKTIRSTAMPRRILDAN